MHRFVTALCCLAVFLSFAASAAAADRPNFLWLTSEDNSPYLGCHGDPLAHTPNLDRLASEGVRFRNFFANAPVCSASRSTLLAGMYGPTLGIHHHRSKVAVPAAFKMYPEVLRQAGYYCTNNVKTDYNVAGAAPAKIWNENSNRAHYKNRKPGQPFFAVFNFTGTHESQVTPGAGKATFRVPPAKVVLPPYHPDIPEIRRDWANYYDQMTAMDAQVGAMLDELKQAGLADDTIVFYYGDHGGALPGGKRSLTDRGTRVPLIVRIPEKWKQHAPVAAGGWVEDLATFVDLPPTVFALAGIDTPKNYQGQAMLGEGRPSARASVYLHRGRMDERCDFVRSVRTKDSLYVRNYSPHRPEGQHYSYPFQVQASMRAWYAAFESGQCNDIQSAYWKPRLPAELYDMAADPFNTRNLLADPSTTKLSTLSRATSLATELRTHLIATRDTGFIPEGMFAKLAGDKTIYDYAQSSDYPIEAIIELADAATMANEATLPMLRDKLASPHPVLRYWAATGCLILKERSAPAKGELIAALADPAMDVRVVAAEALGYLGEADKGVTALEEVIRGGNGYERLAALNALDYMTGAGHVPLEKAQTVVNGLKLGEPADRVQKFILNGRKWAVAKYETPTDQR